jgi:hypothetical protein
MTKPYDYGNPVSTGRFSVSILKAIIAGTDEAPATEPDDSPSIMFDAAIAAFDRAAAERQAATVAVERRMGVQDRRQGTPDTRPTGTPERRNGLDRRRTSLPFGKRTV